MASAAIRELRQSLRIVGKSRFVAVQTPAHIDGLWVSGDFNLGHITMTILTVKSRGDMRAMGEMDEVRHLCDRHPGNWFVV